MGCRISCFWRRKKKRYINVSIISVCDYFINDEEG